MDAAQLVALFAKYPPAVNAIGHPAAVFNARERFDLLVRQNRLPYASSFVRLQKPKPNRGE